jgi:hypothetical protein
VCDAGSGAECTDKHGRDGQLTGAKASRIALGLSSWQQEEQMKTSHIVRVVGTGTLGEPLIGLLLNLSDKI